MRIEDDRFSQPLYELPPEAVPGSDIAGHDFLPMFVVFVVVNGWAAP
jgi:hypothetical protein